MQARGTSAPDFTLADQSGNEISLSEVLQKQPVLLYFYPADFTPGCTKEACMIRDRYDDILDVGVTVMGVSAQDEGSHARFSAQHELPFSLLADTDGTVAKLYQARGMLGITKRITYLINQEGEIEDAVNAMIRIGPHEELINEALQRYAEK